MVLGKKWLFLIGNGAEIRPLEMGRKSPDGVWVSCIFKQGTIMALRFVTFVAHILHNTVLVMTCLS